MKIKSIYIGGWFQRTTLHLSEMYDFFRTAESPLALDKKKLRDLRQALKIRQVEMRVGRLDFIRVRVQGGISISIFEDGLMVLRQLPTKNTAQDIEKLRGYFEERLSPALKYLFSLGAPVPKELANIKTIYPYFVLIERGRTKDILKLLQSFKQTKYFEYHGATFDVYRGDKLYIINRLSEPVKNIERLIEEQIFIREFKTQMHRYLNLHRGIWEKIEHVKEQGQIRGREIGPFRADLKSYEKTITLIDARIEQMDTYIVTRGQIFNKDPHLAQFGDILEFKYETLADTLEYIKDLWEMTRQYVNSALSLFTELAAKSTESSVKNLTVVTSMGVGATLIGLFSQPRPNITSFGIWYFVALATIGFTTEWAMRWVAKNRTYRIKDIKIAKNL